MTEDIKKMSMGFDILFKIFFPKFFPCRKCIYGPLIFFTNCIQRPCYIYIYIYTYAFKFNYQIFRIDKKKDITWSIGDHATDFIRQFNTLSYTCIMFKYRYFC